jgi:hypothetical protein
VIGSTKGHLFLRVNEGTKEKPSFAQESVDIRSGKATIANTCSDCIPSVVDWDGDGLFDLVSGGGSGGVYWMRNTGKKGAPAFADPRPIVEPRTGERGTLRDPTWPGNGTQACVTDFDGDGDLDVLVGDFNSDDSRGDGPRELHGWVWLFRRK